MSERANVADYLGGAESLRRRELVWGTVREPPAPFWPHQEVVTRATVLLYEHVERHRLGAVSASPLDVVLDEDRGLVVQPDVVFLSNQRLRLIDDQVWGPPDSRGRSRVQRHTSARPRVEAPLVPAVTAYASTG